MAWLLVGSIPGVLLGSHYSIRVPERVLRMAFAFVLVLSGIKILQVPAATTIIVVATALAACVALGLTIRRLLRRRLPAPIAE